MRALLASALACAALAGCLADERADDGADGDAAPQAGGTGESLAWPELRFEGCRHQLAFFPVDLDEAQARMPAGFTAIGNVPGMADLLVLTTSCDRLAQDGQASQEVLSGILVEPPEDSAKPGADLHFVYTWLATSSEAASAAYTSWGLQPALGGITIVDGDGQPAAAGEATFGTAHVRTAVAGQPSDGPAGSVRGYVADGDAVRVAVDFVFPAYLIQSGSAVLQDAQGVTGFANDAVAGLGYQEYGDGYGITVTPAPGPVA